METGNSQTVDVAVLGAGFSGIGMAIGLDRAGRGDYVVLEKADDIGGTWRENIYPGCACDVPSHLYSFSFEPNPDWSRMYSCQPEILGYLQRVVEKYRLRPKIRFGARVDAMRWNDATARWHIATAGGEVVARVVVSGMGGLHIPNVPDLPGRASFAGAAFHSATWDASVDLTGKAVAVVGTGASAIQIVPQLAGIAGRLTLFQRTPAWILPKLDRKMRGWERRLFGRVPFAQGLLRRWIYAVNESRAGGFTKNGGLLKFADKVARKHIADQVPDEALRAKLTPDYAIGCKRILIANDFYPALQRPNAALVTEAVTAVTPTGLVTADGAEHPADAIVWATGFQPFSQPVAITGRGGRKLADDWARGPSAYLGLATVGYPNLFFLMGPNTGLGHNSMIYMIESQIAFVLSALSTMDREGVRAVEPKPQVHAGFAQEVQRRLAASVWQSGCRSWYNDGGGRNATLWPGFTFEYRRRTKTMKMAEFEAV